MSLENLYEEHSRNYLGAGYFSRVVRTADNEVVKFRTQQDGIEECYSDDFSFLLWCHKRLLRYGARSPEMRGLPLVWEVSPCRRYARMSKLEPIYTDFWVNEEARELAGDYTGSDCGRRILPDVYQLLRKTFKGANFDTHALNVMWCPVRECFVLNDPFSKNPTRVKSPTPKRTASWRPKYGPNCLH